MSFTIYIYTAVCGLRAAPTSNSADLIGRLKCSKHYNTLQEQIYSFSFLDFFCAHLQGVPGSRGLPGADGRAGVMVRLLPGSLFLNHLLLYTDLRCFLLPLPDDIYLFW